MHVFLVVGSLLPHLKNDYEGDAHLCTTPYELWYFRERDVALLQQKEARNSLREKLQNQLKAAEFRFLNEKLYRADKSDDILDDASAKIYHEGFSRQVQRWPVNPVTVLIKHVRKRVPRKHVIADLGCGDAKIAAAVQNTVHSFDLIKHNERLVN